MTKKLDGLHQSYKQKPQKKRPPANRYDEIETFKYTIRRRACKFVETK